MMNSSLLKDRIMYWLLAMAIATLVFPSYSLNSQAIIFLVVYWLFYSSIKSKIELFRENWKPFLLLSIPFWSVVVGLLYTSDMHSAIRAIELKIPFLVFPLVFSTVSFSKKTSEFVLKIYGFAIIAAIILALIKVFYFKVNNLGDYFYYDKFAEIVDKHTTYFSLFVVVCMLFMVRQFMNQRSKVYYVIGFAVLFGILYVLSVRISVIALGAGMLVLFLFQGNKKVKIGALLTVPLLLGALYLTPNFQKRFEPSKTETLTMDDLSFRKLHWQAVTNTIKNNSILIGAGTRGNREFLFTEYDRFGLSSAAAEEYNAHNQYLETALDFGLIGLVIFLIMLLYLSRYFILNRGYLELSLVCVFMIYMITESILERHSGIVFFSYLMSLLFTNIKQNKKG